MNPKLLTFLDRCAYWALPGGFYDLLKKARSQSATAPAGDVSSPVADLVHRNREFRGCHQGERCFILATGPSIAKQDLSRLGDEYCIAVSHFFLHKDIRAIAPRYHVVAPYHAPFTFADVGKLVEGMHEHYSDETTCFFCHAPYPYSTSAYFAQHPERAFRNAHFIDYTQSTALDEQNYLDRATWDISGAPFQVRTVIYAAIQVALYMGFKEIYLLGCDHDYLHDMKRVSNHHFYKEEEGVSDVEHLSAFTSERWFQEYYYRWKQYRLMMEYAQQAGSRILNATEGGMLDVFPRVRLDDVLSARES